MAELRWHPLIQDWVMINCNRQNRPQHAKGLVSFLSRFRKGTGRL